MLALALLLLPALVANDRSTLARCVVARRLTLSLMPLRPWLSLLSLSPTLSPALSPNLSTTLSLLSVSLLSLSLSWLSLSWLSPLSLSPLLLRPSLSPLSFPLNRRFSST